MLETPNAFPVYEECTMVISTDFDVDVEAIWSKAPAMSGQNINQRQCSNLMQVVTRQQVYPNPYRRRVQEPTGVA